eukprot:TRINITY_DN6489_c0_g1_i1.p1 TRINITY_DN6489_c0_g1~~TRINITY_DN6489_c0_g1_i1.p1  ORF type:complete len:231 (+),score=55.79 TRINITY_DN6489_c0_g1_i1:70-762(+)
MGDYEEDQTLLQYEQEMNEEKGDDNDKNSSDGEKIMDELKEDKQGSTVEPHKKLIDIEQAASEFNKSTGRRYFGESDIKCYTCGEKGHMSMDCTSGPVCYNCNERGHISRDCTKRRGYNNNYNNNNYHSNSYNNEKSASYDYSRRDDDHGRVSRYDKYNDGTRYSGKNYDGGRPNRSYDYDEERNHEKKRKRSDDDDERSNKKTNPKDSERKNNTTDKKTKHNKRNKSLV